MDRIEKSGVLGRSKRQHDLLRYLLSKNEKGELDSVNEYSIAQDVLGRDESFDPQIDSNVRVEMHRLRQNLKHFSQIDDVYTITLPRSSYRLRIAEKGPKGTLKAEGPRITTAKIIVGVVSVVVIIGVALLHLGLRKEPSMLPLVQVKLGSQTATSEEAQQYLPFEQRLYELLSTEGVLRIVGGNASANQVDYILKIDSPSADAGIHVVLSTPDHEVIWSRNLDGEDMSTPKAQRKAATDFAERFVHADNMILEHYINRKDVPEATKAFVKCVADLEFAVGIGRVKWHSSPTELHDCPQYFVNGNAKEKSLAHNLMVSYFLAQHKGYLPETVTDPYARAEQEQDYVKNLDRTQYRYYQNAINLERERRPVRDYDKLHRLLEEVGPLYPEDSSISHLTAQTYGYTLGEWDMAVAALPTVPEEPSHYVRIMYNLVNENYETAARLMDDFPSTDIPIYNAMGAVAYCKAGDLEMIKKYQGILFDRKIATVEDYTKFIKSREYAPVTEKVFLSITEDPKCAVLI